jgi:predicted nucleic acid-binding protein
MNVVIDTSVWSLGLRRKHESLNPIERRIVSELTELVREGRVRILGLVRQELLSGIKTPEQYETLRTRISFFPDEPVDTSDHEDAARFSNQGRSKGVVITIVDALICAVAIKRQWSIMTTDPDFSTFAKVIPLALHAPRES